MAEKVPPNDTKDPPPYDDMAVLTAIMISNKATAGPNRQPPRRACWGVAACSAAMIPPVRIAGRDDGKDPKAGVGAGGVEQGDSFGATDWLPNGSSDSKLPPTDSFAGTPSANPNIARSAVGASTATGR